MAADEQTVPMECSIDRRGAARQIEDAAIKARVLWPRDKPAIQSAVRGLSSEGFNFIDADSRAAH